MGCGASSSSTNVSQPRISKDDSKESLPVVEEAVQREQGSGINDAAIIPDYWYNKKISNKEPFYDMYYVHDSEHGKFDDMMRASYVARCTQDRPCPTNTHSRTPGGCPCVQPGGDLFPVGFRVQRVIRVEASGMWGRYYAKREAISKNRGGKAPARFEPPLMTEQTTAKYRGLFAPLDAGMNEVYTFHGTFVRYALSIAQNDFNINMAGSNRGTLYGRGAYLGESITKADEYAKDEPGGYYAGVFAVLVCRVCMGKLYCTGDDPEAAAKIKSGEYDSTCGQRLFRELVIYDSDQLYPEYVVLYKRITKNDVEEEIAKILKRRFFMEVPLHWRNTAKSLNDGFCVQHANTPPTNDFFQCLVNDSVQGNSQALQSSYRVENAELWKRYVEYKFTLRKRLGGPDGGRAEESPHSLDVVHKQLKELTKWPCKFAKSGCKFGNKCRFAHNENALKLSNVSLSAGRRLPADELDVQLNEHFLWYPCNKRGSNALSKGNFRKDGSATFYTSLSVALKSIESEENIKYAMLCRVICGVNGEDYDASKEFEVTIPNAAQVYPEFIMELFSAETNDQEKTPVGPPDVCGNCGLVSAEPLVRDETMPQGAESWFCSVCWKEFEEQTPDPTQSEELAKKAAKEAAWKKTLDWEKAKSTEEELAKKCGEEAWKKTIEKEMAKVAAEDSKLINSEESQLSMVSGPSGDILPLLPDGEEDAVDRDLLLPSLSGSVSMPR